MIHKHTERWMCDKGAHQLHLGTGRNAPVVPNWSQQCQCCHCLWYPGKYLRLGTLVSYSSAQVLEACDCLKLLSNYVDLLVDSAGVAVNLVFSALIFML